MRDVALDAGRLTIGRRADNDVCLPYAPVSADHAVVVTVLGDSFLEDLGSTNGTLVNGNRVVKHFLRDHDKIDIGSIQLMYLVNDAETVDPLPPEVQSQQMHALNEPLRNSECAATDATADGRAIGGHAPRGYEAQVAPVDDLLADLMESNSGAAVAVDMPPTVSVVPGRGSRRKDALDSEPDSLRGVFIEVISGPNAGRIKPMTKSEFILGRQGSTMAVIRRESGGYRLVPVDTSAAATLNGLPIAPEGAPLSFGDIIAVAGVKMRFGRRPPL